ncbi:glycosyltransferase family 4 protein [Marinobacter sp.]|uniref:glycosyltransferase family 4 protein n=1 Tax=Marinobacter sp. TaxID=50741 RepID=UPI0035661543
MEDKEDIFKVVHFVHWSRSGITELLRNTESFNTRNSSALVLLNSDEEFDGYFNLFSPKIQLFWSSDKFTAIFRFIRFMRAFSPNIIHCHSFTPLFFSIFFTRNRPIFCTVHSNYNYFSKRDPKSFAKRVFLRKFSSDPRVHFIAVSKIVAESLERLGVDDVEIWPNALQDTKYQKMGIREQNEEIRVCILSRLDPQKNIKSVINAVYKFNKTKYAKKITLDIFGLGEQYGLLNDLINEKGMSASVNLMGYTKNADKALINYDFFVSASTNEAFGLSILEACRGRVPVIATNEGEVANRLWENNACIKIEGSNEDAILEAFEMALTMRNESIINMAIRARQIFLKNYTLNDYARKSYGRYADYA